MPSSAPRTPPKVPAIVAAAVLLSAPITSAFEGLRTKPYPDPGNPKLMSVCYGETQRPMRQYTADECKALLRQRQMNDYAPQVLKCVPGFSDRRRLYAFAASVDASYNAGLSAFCKSPMARSFNAGQWKAGCQAFRGWFVKANHKILKGLVRRREAEAQLCLKSV